MLGVYGYSSSSTIDAISNGGNSARESQRKIRLRLYTFLMSNQFKFYKRKKKKAKNNQLILSLQLKL